METSGLNDSSVSANMLVVWHGTNFDWSLPS